MAFELPSLAYSKTALAAKGMCEETLDLHYGKHHQAYVTALNGFVEKDAALQGKSMQEFLRAELERLAARPSIDAWLQQVRKRKRAAQSRISSEQILNNRNADRR